MAEKVQLGSEVLLAYVGNQGPKGRQVNLVQEAHQDILVSWVLQASQDPKALQATKEVRVLQVNKDHLENMVILDLLVTQARPEYLEGQVHPGGEDLPVLLVEGDLRDLLGSLENKDCREPWDSQVVEAREESWVILDQLGAKGKPECQANPDRKDLLDQEVMLVVLAYQEKKDDQESKETQVRKVHQVAKDQSAHKDLRVWMDLWVIRVKSDLVDLQDLLENVDRWDNAEDVVIVVILEKWAQSVRQAETVTLGHPVRRVHSAQWDLQDLRDRLLACKHEVHAQKAACLVIRKLLKDGLELTVLSHPMEHKLLRLEHAQTCSLHSPTNLTANTGSILVAVLWVNQQWSNAVHKPERLVSNRSGLKSLQRNPHMPQIRPHCGCRRSLSKANSTMRSTRSS